ncbi:hypothetical protein [Pedobacter sp. JCM 36344]|uniref:hypothetical protein n=1 Tax=Pedobacter sp. JCM 36344 TaxID=3374280 RepID=UPI0039784B66
MNTENENISPSSESTKQAVDNELILSAQSYPTSSEKPINEEVNRGYNSADDTGNTNDDLELDLSDDPETDLDEGDLEALNGQDIDEDETMS